QGPKGDKGDTGSVGLQGAQGPQGPKGDKGDAGAQGLKGDKGDTGAQGNQGLKGDKGDIGATGLKGDKGDKGDTGAQGIQGLKGDKGDVGVKGDKGDTGAQGIQGLKGDKGDVGATGLKGDKGDAGAQGIQGVKGDKGNKGDTGDQGIQGPKGDKGDTGATGAQGIQGPAGSYTAGSGISISNGVLTNTGDTNGNDDLTNATVAAGDVTGNFGNLRVDGIEGKPISGILAPDNILKYTGTSWVGSLNDFENTNEIQIIQNQGTNIFLSGSTATKVDLATLPGLGSRWTASGNDIYYASGKVGIGTGANRIELKNSTEIGIFQGGSERLRINGLNGGTFVNGSTTIDNDGVKIVNKLAVGSSSVSGSAQAFIQSSSTNPLLVVGKSNTALMATESGSVSIGVQASPSLIPVQGLFVQGQSNFNSSITVLNGTATKPGGGSWSAPSDARLKEHIKPYQRGLAEVLAVMPVTYQYNGKMNLPPDKIHAGVIAQDLAKVAPEMVEKMLNQKDTDFLTVNSSDFTYMLINAVKELSNQNNELKSRLEKLESMVNILSSLDSAKQGSK
ncbi:MAG TPA: tail fiber domain-containing protein, partial [Saprospiraceae bacterium]|nr:tail fiber domain-containing protein [Saprospiraceae bacterium]